jgi:hypothetical protein
MKGEKDEIGKGKGDNKKRIGKRGCDREGKCFIVERYKKERGMVDYWRVLMGER